MRKGGTYIKEGGGEPRLVERTEPHPDGDRARDANGKPLPVKPAPAPAPAQPAAQRAAKAKE